MFFGVWDFIFQSSSFWDFPLVAFTCAVQTSTGASRRANRGCLRLGWCCFASLPRPLTGHKSSHRGEFGFSPQNELTPPPKGGGAGYHLGWVCWGFHAEKPGTFPQEKTDTSYPRASLGSCHRQLLVTNGSHGFNRACLGLPWCRFPTLSPKPHTGPHRAEFGFRLLTGASQEDFPLFRQSRIRTQADQAEEKIPLPHFSEMEPVKSVIPCKRFFKPSGVKSFSLFMRRKFCGGIPVRKELSRLTFSPYKAANPACPGPGSYHLNLWWERLTPPCLAPICTPRPLGWAGSCTGAHRFVLCRLSLGRWFSPCR